MSYAELWASMGPFAKGIVVVMFVMSAWSWAVSISKQIYLRKSQKETRKFAPEFSRYLQEEQLDGAIALAEKNKKSHVAQQRLHLGRACRRTADAHHHRRAEARSRHPGDDRRDCTVRRPARHDDGYRNGVPRHVGVRRLRLARRDHGRRRRGAYHD